MSAEGIIIALGTALTAVFTGGLLFHTLLKDRLKITGCPNGGFKVLNPSNRTIVVSRLMVCRSVIHWLMRKRYILGYVAWVSDNETDFGEGDKLKNRDKTVLECDFMIPPGEQTFNIGLCLQEKYYWVNGKTRRLKWFHPERVDIILSPGHQISEIGENR